MSALSPLQNLLALGNTVSQCVRVGLRQWFVEHPARDPNNAAFTVELDVVDRDGVE